MNEGNIQVINDELIIFNNEHLRIFLQLTLDIFTISVSTDYEDDMYTIELYKLHDYKNFLLKQVVNYVNGSYTVLKITKFVLKYVTLGDLVIMYP